MRFVKNHQTSLYAEHILCKAAMILAKINMVSTWLNGKALSELQIFEMDNHFGDT